MKCEKCENKLIEFTKKGEVKWCEHYVDEEGELQDYDGGQYHGQESSLMFCKECKTFYESYFGIIHDDSNEYMQVQEEVSLEEILYILSQVIQENPEHINFSEFKQICKALKIDIADVMKNIAFRVVEQQRPNISNVVDVDTDNEVPF